MDHHEGDQQPGDDEHVQREEARQRRARDDRTAEQEVHEPGSHDRHAARDRHTDPESPVRVLVEAKHLPRERHSERHQKQQDADDPRQLSRILVRPEQEDLHHVDEHDGDHEVRSPSVHRADEPAEGNVVIQDLQAAPGLARGRHVHEGEQDAGDDLEDEDGERGAAEDVEPARRLAGHRVRHRRPDRRAELEALIEPVAHALDQAHDGFSAATAATRPGVGISPALMKRFPASIL